MAGFIIWDLAWNRLANLANEGEMFCRVKKFSFWRGIFVGFEKSSAIGSFHLLYCFGFVVRSSSTFLVFLYEKFGESIWVFFPLMNETLNSMLRNILLIFLNFFRIVIKLT